MDRQQVKKQIVYLQQAQPELSFRQIAQTLGISRGKCLRAVSNQQRTKARPVREQYRQLVSQWYQDCPSLSALQVHTKLKKSQIALSYWQIKVLTKEFRDKYTQGARKRCYWPLIFAAGEEAQVDWFIIKHPVLGQLAGFAMVLSYSRYLYCKIFPSMSFEFFIQGHVNAFAAMGGTALCLRYDNLKSVVISREPVRRYNTAFLEFATFIGFEIRLCNVRAGNEKGRVERVIRTIRESFLNSADHHRSLPAFNAALEDWVIEKNSTVHKSTLKTPLALKATEKLKQVPSQAWLNRVVYPPKVPTKTGFIHFASNQYSVPEYLLGQSLSVHAYCERVEIYTSDNRCIATHERCFDRNRMFLNPAHRTFGKCSAPSKVDRIYTVISRLEPIVAEFLTLNQDVAKQDSKQTALAVFKLLKIHSKHTIVSAIRELVSKHKIYTLQLIHKILGMHSCDSISTTPSPINKQLLSLDYTPRDLALYEK